MPAARCLRSGSRGPPARQTVRACSGPHNIVVAVAGRRRGRRAWRRLGACHTVGDRRSGSHASSCLRGRTTLQDVTTTVWFEAASLSVSSGAFAQLNCSHQPGGSSAARRAGVAGRSSAADKHTHQYGGEAGGAGPSAAHASRRLGVGCAGLPEQSPPSSRLGVCVGLRCSARAGRRARLVRTAAPRRSYDFSGQEGQASPRWRGQRHRWRGEICVFARSATIEHLLCKSRATRSAGRQSQPRTGRLRHGEQVLGPGREAGPPALP